ncbi:flagellar hook-associated protein FlgK [Alkalihalobacillus sp. BA299]|uniref:flagellar hook-associated protein FlgK n=1 Tax=Alkalihalobacillus sp. BA299 TaxID=2815938 RepID=UPI001AD98DC6|nr:flagellar hook-associated protein FlgK [Alkalihalobacillus sp. BA299]
MISSFHGLETARRSLMAHQGALQTTGHNIANANTPGYSRQRVNLTPGEPFPGQSFSRPGIPGQIGTGVQVDSIQRYREQFLDLQFRNENSKHGFWDARFEALHKMEDILNEPSEDGIAKTMDKFWNALQDLSVHPEDSGARSVVRQQGYALADTFNYAADSLTTVQRDIQKEIDGNVHEMNTLIRQINNINLQIAKVEPHGYVPNDLYDRRDVLVDEISKLANIRVERVDSGGNPSSVAEGLYNIKLADENGRDVGVTLVDARNFQTNEAQVKYQEMENGEKGLIEKIYFGSPDAFSSNPDLDAAGGIVAFRVDEFNAHGKLVANMESYGFFGAGGQEFGLYPNMLNQLDVMVYTFVQEFNSLHQAGWNLDDIKDGIKGPGIDFFTYKGDTDRLPTSDDPRGAASKLQLSADIRNSLDKIAASSNGTTVYGSMTPSDPAYTGANPNVSGVYTGTGPDTVEVQYVSANDQWQYQVNGADWAAMPSDFTVNGITINVSAMDKNNALDNTVWSISDLVNGAQTIGYAGDGSNALALANVKDRTLNYGGSTTNVQSFYQGIIGDMAVNTNEADRMKRNADTLRTAVEERRMAASNVSLDEEMTNIIKYQHAYNAAARNITMVDDMLDRIINRMGRSGL